MINFIRKKNIYINQFNPAGERCLLPLAAGLLASCIQEDPFLKNNFNTQINILRNDPVQTVKDMQDPAVICFSTYVWNIRQSLAVARIAKQRFPQAIIVFGGPSTPRCEVDIGPFFKNYDFIDVIVHGEGEQTFVVLLKSVLDKPAIENVLGISFRSPDHREGYVINAARKRIQNMEAIPSPFLNGVFDKLLSRHKDRITGTVWETSRGCPFQCTFCDWGQATQGRVHIHAHDRLIAEMDWISHNQIPYIFAADANFGIKERDLAIARYLGQLYQKNGYPRYMQVNWMKNSRRKTMNIAKTFKEAGFGFMVTLSMQSFDNHTLDSIKRSNIDLETFAELKKDYNELNIDTYSELLLGLPGETYDSFTDGLMKVLSPLPTDHFALYLTTVLPNAEMAKPEYRAEHGIQTRTTKSTMLRQRVTNRHIQEYDETVVGTNTMPVLDWCKAFCFGYLLRTLHNMRLAFFIIDFLRDQYKISPKKYVEYLINAARTPGTASVMAGMIGKLDQYTASILNSGPSTLALEEYPEYYWEPHEMCFLMADKYSEEFYKELTMLTLAFLNEHYPFANKGLVNEICVYQQAVSPLNKTLEPFHITFRYDLSKYKVLWLKNNNKFAKMHTYEFETSYKQFKHKRGIEYLLSKIRACASGSLSLCKIKPMTYVRKQEKVLSIT